MPAAAIPNENQALMPVPLSAMTEEQLETELRFWTSKIASNDRWGSAIAAAFDMRAEVEAEIVRRHVAVRRAEETGSRPFIVDDPGVRYSSRPVIVGTAKARAEWRPSGAILVAAVALLVLILAAAAAMAGQTLLALEADYAARALV